MKTCSKCKKEKPRDCFFRRSLAKDGLSPSCKDCFKQYWNSYKKTQKRKNSIKRYNKSPKRRIVANRWTKKRWRESEDFRLKSSMSTLIYYALKEKKNNRSWEKIVGYTLEDLKENIESKFEPWMNWGNHGLYRKNDKTRRWHIDHIKPRNDFDFTKDSEIKECWSLDNIRPLCGLENIIKGSRVDDNSITIEEFLEKGENL